MIDFLALIESFIEITLALRMRPKHVPVVAIRGHKAIYLKEETNEFGLALEHLVVNCGLAHLRIGIRGGAGSCGVLLSEVSLVRDKCVDAFDQVLVALRNLLDMTSPVIPGHAFDVKDLEKFELDEIVVAVSVLHRVRIGY